MQSMYTGVGGRVCVCVRADVAGAYFDSLASYTDLDEHRHHLCSTPRKEQAAAFMHVYLITCLLE